MYNLNNTSNTSSEGREVSPVTIVYTVGEGFSILSLAIVIATYTLTKRRQTVSGRLMVNFCSSLMLLYIESICNAHISASGSDIGCVVVGVLGHWIFLAMLTSLAVYAAWLYVKLVKVFSKELSHYVIKAVMATWVIPLMVALISVAPDYHQYRRSERFSICEAQGYAMYFGILLPSVILVSLTMVALTLCIVSICKSQNNQALQNQSRDCAARTAKMKRRTWLFLGLLILVVLGWGSALASAQDTPTPVTVVTVILFLSCGFGQGVYVFLFVCVFNSSVRSDWKTLASHVVQLSFSTIQGRSSSADNMSTA